MDVCSIPFNSQLGLTSVTTDTGTAISLSPEPRHLNHLGTVHAGAIFAIAEAASGQALVDHFSDLADSTALVLRSATTKYRTPADLSGPLTAQGHIGAKTAETFRQQLTDRGRALIEITTTVVQGDQNVFRGTYSFFAATNT